MNNNYTCLFQNPVYAVPEWVVVYQSTSIGTLFTPLPVSGVHDIFVFPELSKIKKPVSQSVQWPERRFAHAASHITGTVFVMIGGRYGGSTEWCVVVWHQPVEQGIISFHTWI